MKRVSLTLLILICGIAVYLSLPLTSVAVLTLSLSDQNGGKVSSRAIATYLDAQGAQIVQITPDTKGSWDNNLHWWSHSSHTTSDTRPADAKRAASVVIKADNCDEATLSVKLERTYEPMSLAPHGGGAAYFMYRFDQSVVLQCR